MDNTYSVLSKIIEQTLESYGIEVRVAEINTLDDKSIQFCLEIKSGTLISDIEKYQREIALAIASPTGKIRIEAPIPGRSLVGVTVPEIKKQNLPKEERKSVHTHPIARVIMLISIFFKAISMLFELSAVVVDSLGVKATQIIVFILGGIFVTYTNTNSFALPETVLNTIIMFFVFIIVIGLQKNEDKKNEEIVVSEEKYTQALKLLSTRKDVSISFLQRVLKTGYAYAAAVMDKLEKDGYVSEASGNGLPRKVLKKP